MFGSPRDMLVVGFALCLVLSSSGMKFFDDFGFEDAESVLEEFADNTGVLVAGQSKSTSTNGQTTNGASELTDDDLQEEFADDTGDSVVAGKSKSTTEQTTNGAFKFTDDDLQEYSPNLEKRAAVVVPDPIADYPLNKLHTNNERKNRLPKAKLGDVSLADGPFNTPDGSYEFLGTSQSYIEFDNSAGGFDTQYSITMLCWVFPEGKDGPLFNYGKSGPWGVHMWIVGGTFFDRITKRANHGFLSALSSQALPLRTWSHVAASYDKDTGLNALYVNGKKVKELNVGSVEISTNDIAIRMGVKAGDNRFFKGRIAGMQVYDVALNEQQIKSVMVPDINECLTTKPCKNGATCTYLPGDYRCTCKTGFTGKNCQTDINECLTLKPCKNGATCTNLPGSYSCTCQTGFTGKNCGTDINECLATKPCKNGATCTNLPGSYSCTCKTGFTGRNCQTDINECLTLKPCKNGATCTNLPGGYSCTCNPGFTGKNCQTDINECLTTKPCKNSATCTNLPGSYSCTCNTGFTGKNCQTDINECLTTEPCKNGATCTNLPGSYSCTCKTGFTGKNCQTDINECLTTKPCKNGATCTNLPGGYSCTCKSGFTGKNCLTDNDECLTLKPCKNGATCTNLPGDYRCTCKTGFTGKNCQTDIDECVVTQPCKRDSTCTNLPGSYRCSCAPGFKSKNCDQDIDECLVDNGGCSHDCTNTIGSNVCSCPDAELSLADDMHTCEAKGVIIDCLQNEMSITIPKPLLKGMDREHVRLLDPKCGATETKTHYSLKTPLTGCGTTRRHTKSAIVYSNTLLEIPLKINDIVTRVREIEIPFSCYYSNRGVATAVGVKPENRKLVFYEKGKGNFTIALEMFRSPSFQTAYTQSDYPLSLKLRQHMYLQARVESEDKRLSVMAEKCFATPTPDEANLKDYEIITDGCAVDDTVKFLPSPTGDFRFTLEAFEFVDQPFVFMHCHILVCNATDPFSRCARGCEKKDRRVRREVEKHEKLYSLAQGPIALDFSGDETTIDLSEHLGRPETLGMNVPLVAMMAAIAALCVIGVAFMGLRRKPRASKYTELAAE